MTLPHTYFYTQVIHCKGDWLKMEGEKVKGLKDKPAPLHRKPPSPEWVYTEPHIRGQNRTTHETHNSHERIIRARKVSLEDTDRTSTNR